MENKEIVLSVKDLKVNFSTDNGYVQAVRGVSFDLYKGETLCIVGESGSGKSVTNKAIMGILSKNGRVINGSIMYEGEDLTKISEDEFHRIRGHKIGMIFQDPLSSLNPIVRIGKQITEGMLINASRTKRMYDELVADSLTAYRNAQTELKTGLAKGTENIKFLKSEKKKHITLAKNEVANEIGGKIYTEKQNTGAAIFEIENEEHEALLKLRESFGRGEIDEETYNKEKDKIKAKANDKALLKQEFAKRKAEIYSERAELVTRSKAKVAEITAKYDSLIEKARKEYIETKSSLIAEYKPKIAAAKEKFNADSKVAKEKVAAYETELKTKYLKKVNSIKSSNRANVEKLCEDLDITKKEHIAAYAGAGNIEIYRQELKAKEKVKIIKNEIAFNKAKFKADLIATKKEYSTACADAGNDKDSKQELKDKYLEKVNSIKSSNRANVEKLNEDLGIAKKEYSAAYAASKEKFSADYKAAKEKLNAHEQVLKDKYLQKVNSIKSANYTNAEKLNRDLDIAKKEYISSLGIAKAEFENLEKIKAIKNAIAVNNAKSNADLTATRKEYISSLRITKAEAKAKALEVMAEVGIKDPEKRFRQYPFEFSGGMRQRIVIAIALTANPDILICDEPTTALDVTIQAQILELINKLKKERNLSCIFITHDLGVVANMADRVAVMYAGKIVEYGTEEEIFYDPKHPYTWALLSSIPDIDSNERLEAIPGTPPNMIYPPIGDAFALRSKYAMAIDFKKEPPYFKVSDTHYAATWLLDPRAPKVEMPKIVKQRIENSLKAHKKGGNE